MPTERVAWIIGLSLKVLDPCLHIRAWKGLRVRLWLCTANPQKLQGATVDPCGLA